MVTGTMVNVSLPYVGLAFEAPESSYGWVVSGYMLAFGVFSSIFGRLADRYGVRRMYFTGATVFSAMGLVTTFAPSLSALIAGRVVQGLGATTMAALGVTLIARLLPADQRGSAMGVISGIIGTAASVGPILGGVAVQWGSWRMAFAAPLAGLLLLPLFLRVVPAEVDAVKESGPIDGLGALLLAGGATALLLSTSTLKSDGLLSAPTLGLIAASGILLAGLWRWSHRHPTPFLPPALLRNRAFIACCVILALANAGRFGTLILVPILLTVVDSLAPLQVGLALLPGAIATILLSPVAGALSDRGRTRGVVTFGLIAALLGCVCSAMMAGGSPVGTAAGMALYGAGFACIQTPLITAGSRVVSPKLLSTGNGVLMTMLFLGGAMGTALGVALVAAMPEALGAWLPMARGEVSGRFSNTMLLMGVPGVLSLAFIRVLPGSMRSAVAGEAAR